MRISDWSSDVCSSDLRLTISTNSRLSRRLRQNACAVPCANRRQKSGLNECPGKSPNPKLKSSSPSTLKKTRAERENEPRALMGAIKLRYAYPAERKEILIQKKNRTDLYKHYTKHQKEIDKTT